MNISNVQSEAFIRRARTYYRAHNSNTSRRKFLKSIGAAALGVGLGAAFGSRLFPVQAAYAHGSHEPVHIPGGTPVLSGGFHVFGPGTIDPIDAEPSSITDFNGLVGIGFINGTVTRTNTQTGESVVLPTQASDMRFRKGEFRGMDGQFHNGTFGFV